MRHVIRFMRDEIQPNPLDVLERMQVPPGRLLSARLDALLDEGRELFDRLAAPVAVFEEVSSAEFARIYQGGGRNSPASPLEVIVPRATALALFAGTMGSAIDDAIRERCREGDAALGCVLDMLASSAADRLSYLTAQRFLVMTDPAYPSKAVLPYSPGYCGWDVSGQRRLFERLCPEEIGIVLGASCFMQPIKSVSGVLVAGAADIHTFKPTYPFCAACATRHCLGRMRAARTVRWAWES